MPARRKRQRTFPKPARPRSLKRMVRKILAEPDYAHFIHAHVLRARRGDVAAAALVADHFKPQRAELAALNLDPQGFDPAIPGCPGTTNTAFIDFAAAHHIWE